MNAQEIIELIRTSKKQTPVKVTLSLSRPVAFETAKVFEMGKGTCIVFGDWQEISSTLQNNADAVLQMEVESDCRNSAIPLLDTKNLNARIEPGAIIRDQVEIGDNAVIMMGAILNIGAVVGQGTMIDMGAVLGGRATVGKNCWPG